MGEARRRFLSRLMPTRTLTLRERTNPTQPGIAGALLAWPQEDRVRLVAVLQAAAAGPDGEIRAAPQPLASLAPEDRPDPDLGDPEAEELAG